MVSESDIESAHTALRRLLETVGSCSRIGAVLCDFRKPLTSSSWRTPTDFQRAQEAVKNAARDAARENDWLRRDLLHPDLVRSAILIEEIQARCAKCLDHNQGCAPGEFVCLVVSAGRERTLPLRLDKEGNIHE